MQTIGERVKKLRNEKGLTQTEFGNKIGLKQAVIGQYENNTRNVTDRSIKDICRVFNASYAWLVDGVGPMYSDNDAYLKEKIDIIMEGENEFHKNLVKQTLDLTDDELTLLYKIIKNLAK